MAKAVKYVEVMSTRFLRGTFARIDKVKTPIEDRADVVRLAVENEIKRREREPKYERRDG